MDTCPKQTDDSKNKYTVSSLLNARAFGEIVMQCVRAVHAVETNAFPEIAYTQEFIKSEVRRNRSASLWIASRRGLENVNPFGPSAVLGYALTSDEGFETEGYSVEPKDGYVLSVGVLDEARGQGIGRDLLQNYACYSLFMRSRVQTVRLTMRRNNDAMRKVVEHVGFERGIELGRGLYGDGELRDEYTLTYDDWKANLPAKEAASLWYCGGCDDAPDGGSGIMRCPGLRIRP